MSAAEITQVLIEHAWLASPAAVWCVHKTRMARTASKIIRVAVWDWLLRLKGVSVSKRRKLISDAAQRDLKSP